MGSGQLPQQEQAFDLAKIIAEASDAAASKAVRAYKDEVARRRMAELKDAHYNTRLLLRNYHRLVAHGQRAVCSEDDVPSSMIDDDVQDLLRLREPTRLQGLYESKTRTRIMVAHLNTCLDLLREATENESISRWRAFDLFWLDPEMQQHKIGARVADICERLNDGRGWPCEKTVRNWIDDMVLELSALLWGIDGLSDKNAEHDLGKKAGSGMFPKGCQKPAL